jgi:uncharacterized lipoprotein YmbA
MKVVYTLLLALLTGCASQVVEPNYYLLRSEQASASSTLVTSQTYSLGTVEIAAYLDQPGLVVETNDGRMRPAAQNLWAEPIYDGVRNLLSTEIAAITGQQLLPTKLARDTTIVNIRIDLLHGTLDGKAQLVAYWWLVRDDEVLVMKRFSEERTLASSGYSALVDAEKALLTALASQIGATLTTASH